MNMQGWKNLSLMAVIGLFVATGALACGEMDEQHNQQQNNDENNDTQNNDTQNNDENNDTQNNDENNDTENQIDPDDYIIEVAGTWETVGEFEDTVTITDDVWDSEAWIERHVSSFDNVDEWVVVHTPEDADDDGADTYSRIVWTDFDGDSFFYCEDAFFQDSMEDARDAESGADADDLDEGCGEGNPWSELTRQ